MGIIRMGEPELYPDTDTMVVRGIKYNLDMVTLKEYEAENRKRQLEMNGKTVYVQPRQAPPEETMNHMPNKEMDGTVHLDGRRKWVWDVWVAVGRTYRKKTKRVQKPKSKRISMKCRCKK